jgi:hypothetical protein
VIVTDHNGNLVDSNLPVINQHNGVVTFKANSTSSTFFVYWLPYTQSGEGSGLKFSWILDDDFISVGSFNATLGSHLSQTFVLPEPVTDNHFRWRCLKTGGYQPFVREIRLKETPASFGCWLPNTATHSNPQPVSSCSGWLAELATQRRTQVKPSQ